MVLLCVCVRIQSNWMNIQFHGDGKAFSTHFESNILTGFSNNHQDIGMATTKEHPQNYIFNPIYELKKDFGSGAVEWKRHRMSD